jgi:glycosyltransferase involved in cell wall biosynthesis
VGIITDDFAYRWFENALELTYLEPDDYCNQLPAEATNFDFVLYISAWRGMTKDKYWTVDGTVEAMRFFRKEGIATVFYSIEDPPDFEKFLPIARESDYIFTSAIEKVRDYKDRTDNSNVFPLEYGVNPIVTNPIGAFDKYRSADKGFLDAVLFAGSWYGMQEDRCRDTQVLFDGVLQSSSKELLVIDRNSNLDPSRYRVSDYIFPDKYHEYIAPAVDYLTLNKINKLFDWSLCLNIVKDSATMCAMRAYEHQALGLLMISNYALALSRNFPNIFTAFESSEVARILDGYSQAEIREMQITGIRNIMRYRTVYDRLNYIFDCCKMPWRYGEKPLHVVEPPCTGVIDSDYIRAAMGLDATRETDPAGGYLLITSNKNRNYALDLLDAHKYTDVGFVAYGSQDNLSECYNYTSEKPTQEDVMFDLGKISIDDIAERSFQSGVTGFNIPRSCYSREVSYVEGDGIKGKSIAVVVPVFNNGAYLRDRAIVSLTRSSIFDKMHIYLIDDGSTDDETKGIVAALTQIYGNMSSHYLSHGGSGSASRARNAGIELAKEPYLTFFDPDNEAINDGYAVLFDCIKTHSEYAFVLGGTKWVRSNAEYASVFSLQTSEIPDAADFMIGRDFQPFNCQTMLIRSKFLHQSGIRFVEGALGQDTLFAQELCLRSRAKAYNIDTPVQLYYAEREGSAVNDVTASFFRKFLKVEQATVKMLTEENLLEEYKARRLRPFVENWYLEKLKHCPVSELRESLGILSSILGLYCR